MGKYKESKRHKNEYNKIQNNKNWREWKNWKQDELKQRDTSAITYQSTIISNGKINKATEANNIYYQICNSINYLTP